MLISAIGYLNQKGIRIVEDYSVQSRYDNASLFGQIEHNPVDFKEYKKQENLIGAFKSLFNKKPGISNQQALDMIG